MKRVTSAYASKLIRQLEDDKAYWRNKERESDVYTAAITEEPVIPEYDYEEVSKLIAEIDEKVCKLRHAINLANVTTTIMVGEKSMTVDAVLVRMSQLSNRKSVLDSMRKRLPQVRIPSFGGRNQVPEYQYINYDLDVVKADYEKVNEEIMMMQMALDKHNQTFEFEVDID